MRLVPLGESCERRKVPSPEGAPSLVGKSAETKRELQRLRGMQQLAEQRETSVDSPSHLPALHSLKCALVCLGAGG